MEAVLIAPLEVEKTIKAPIQDSLAEAGVKIKTSSDFLVPSQNLLDSMTDAIRSADLVIVDITEVNTEVDYALGFAHGMRKNTMLLLNREAARVPPYLAGELVFVYSSNDLDKLGGYIKHQVLGLKGRRKALA